MEEKKTVSSGNQTSGGIDNTRPAGKLKVFFSYAPGTGKSLAMLEDAYRRLQEGVDVVVGYVDTQGELLTMQLLQKFEVIPQRAVNASGITAHRIDLDRLLERHPQIALIDHLARGNPPGMRHVARYLEIEELLNAGIDVYTTFNVYQLESQVDAVSYFTGVTVRETVPDHFLDRVERLEMVDIPPQDLLARYQSGKIVVPARVQTQIEKFFQPANLFALRELALRYVARRSNTFLRTYLKERGLAQVETTSTRLLVCISDSPNAGRLVRAGRRMSDENRAEWTVVHVETPGEMYGPAEARNNVARHLQLAEMLGANTEILTGRTVKEAIREYAQAHHYRQVMIGRSMRGRLFNMVGVTLAEQLIRDDPTISIYVVGSDHTPRPFQIPRFWNLASRMQLLGALLLAVVPTLLGRLLTPTIISRSSNLIMLYLLGVIIASIFLGLVPALLTAVLSVLLYDFFFVPPIYSLIGVAPENLITFAGLLLISGIISTLVTRERMLTRAARRRTDQVTQLYELNHKLAIAVDMPDILQTLVDHVQQTLDREVVILLPKNGELVLSASSSGQALDSSELTAAEWAFQQGRPAGNNTGTFSYASYRYLPLQTSRRILGVIGVRLAGITPDLHPEQMRMLGAFTTNASSAVERALLAEEASQTEILRATEKLQTALLNSISHDLRTPLATITGGLSSLRMEEDFLDPETRRELVETALGEAERLNRLVGNLLDMTRLESGAMHISLQPCDIQDVIGSALNTLTARLEGHPVEVELPADLPLVPLDYVLIDQVMINLLDNAVKYSPETSPIEIRAGVVGDMVQVSVEDHGPGIPQEDLTRIFEKFFRVKRFENVVGTGLGLSICKGIVEVHGGKIWAENRQEGGVRMLFSVPLKPLNHLSQEPAVPQETEGIQS